MQAYCIVGGICVFSSVELFSCVSLQVMSDSTDSFELVLIECMVCTELHGQDCAGNVKVQRARKL